ncbi:MAG: hypothetical protein ABIQ65_15735 [Thermoanaerobaculia bacterium]
MTDTIDITPTHDGQIAIANRFARMIIADVKSTKRAAADQELLAGLIDIVFTLGFNAPRHTIEAALAEKEAILAEILG